ncbi:MAG: hypothetical protein KGY69_11225, partial [Bacteroidales bacterium]|nr:hypothetical protein [Bacteroidales bacterium]
MKMKSLRILYFGILVLFYFLTVSIQVSVGQENDTILYENFESGSLPTDWSNEYVKGTIKWDYQDGGYTSNPDVEGSGRPPYAYEGVYNALFHYESLNGEKTKLVTPALNLEYKVKPELTFWHAQDERYTFDAYRNDELRIYYKNSKDGSWVELAEYTSVVEDWTKRSIILPDSSLSSEYYIAFEGKTNNGFGVCIDEVVLEETGVEPKYVDNISYHQASTDFVATQSENNPILRLDIEVEGNDGSINLDSLAVTSMNTDDNDIKENGVKLYASNDTLFENSQQVVNGINFTDEKAVFDQINYEIPRGLSSVWITYDVKADTNHQTQGHVLDAKIKANDLKINNNNYPLVFKSPYGDREIYEAILYSNFEEPGGWSFTGEFERAKAQDPPLGGSVGSPDPANAYEGEYMIGTDITGQGSNPGDYENNIGDRAYQAISSKLDAFYYQDMNLYFYRWLNIDGMDSAYIEISQDDGQSWETIWQNGGSIVMDKWEKSRYDLQPYVNRVDSVRLRFSLGGTDDSWAFSGWNLDNIVITGDYISQDVGITDWIAPENGCRRTTKDSVQVVIENFGGDPTRDTIPLSYSFDGGTTIIRDTLYGSIPVGESTAHTFNTPVDLSESGWYRNVWAQTNLSADEATQNNRFNHELFVFPTYTPPYEEDFEDNYGYWLREQGDTIMEHGIPAGDIVDTAASGQKIWATNLEGLYRINDSSYIESPSFDFADVRNPVFEMKLLGEAEADKDGLALYYSTDNGETWQMVPTSGNYDWNWYTSDYVEGLSGPGWDTTTTTWMKAKQLLPAETAGDSNVKFSLVWGTDGYNRFEGYGIDDIKVYEAPPDVGITSMPYPISQCELSKTVQPEVYIENYGIDTLFAGTNIPIGLRFKDEPRILDTLELTANLVPGDSVHYTIDDTLDMSYAGDYPMKIYTMLEDDPYFYSKVNNDTLTDTISVLGMPRYDIGNTIGTPDPVDTTLDAGAGYASYEWSTGATTQTIDVNSTGWYSVTVTNDTGCVATDSVQVVTSDINTGVTQIITSVSDSCERLTPVEFTVEVSNMGLNNFSSGDTIPMAYQINNQQPVPDTLFLDQQLTNTSPDSTIQFTYSDSIDMSEPKKYNLKFFTDFKEDYNRSNDTSYTTVNTWGYPDTELRYDTLLTTQADSLTLDAGAGFDTYTWQDGSTNQTFDITSNNSQWYKVTVTDAHGCGEDSDSTHIIAIDIGIDSLVYPVNSCEFSSSEQATVRLRNHSADTLFPDETIPMGLKVDGTLYKDTITLTDSILPDSTSDLTLTPTFDISAVGSHSFTVYTSKNFDASASNDTIRKTIDTWGYPEVEIARDTIYTTQADTITLNAGEGFDSYLWQDSTTTTTYDVTQNLSREYSVTVSDDHGCGTDKDSVQVFTYNMGVDNMLAPSSECELSSTEEIRVKVKNYSYDTLKAGESMELGYILNESDTIRETKTFSNNLLPGGIFSYTFSAKADMSDFKTYQFNFFTDHPHDADHSNDTLLDAVKTYGNPEFDLNYDTLYTTQADTVELYPDISVNSYRWNTGSTNDTLYVSKPTSEEYKLTVTDINGCSATDSSTLFTYDLSLTSMSSPVSDCELTNSENLTIEVTNNGADTLQSGSQIPVGYQVYGGDLNTVISDTIILSSNLLPESTIQYTFSNTLDMSVTDVYDFTVYTNYPNDAASGNDTLNQQVENYGYPQIDLGPDTLFTAQPDTLELDPGSGYASYLWQDGSTSQIYDVTSNETNLYHVEVTNDHGCTTMDSMQVIVDYDLKALSITSPDAEACELSSQEKVTATFYNQSRAIEADQTLTFTLVSPEGIHYNENYILSSPLNTGDTLEWKFSQTLDLSDETTHQIKAYVTYDMDLFPGNDTTSKTIEVFSSPKPDLGKDTVVSATSYTLDPGSFEAYEWHDGSNNQTFKVTPGSRTADDKYYVTVTDQNGCEGRDTAEVILNIDDIEISEILSPVDLCGTSSSAPVEFILENSGTSNIPKNTELPLSYQLNNEGSVQATLVLSEVLSPAETLTYTFDESISLTNTGDYDFSLSVEYDEDMWPDNNDTSYTFTVNPQPDVDLGSDTLETDLPHTLDPGDYESYEWQDGSTEREFEVTDPGTYSVTVSNEYGCTASDTIVIRNANAIGDDTDQAENYTVKVYPVPA